MYTVTIYGQGFEWNIKKNSLVCNRIMGEHFRFKNILVPTIITNYDKNKQRKPNNIWFKEFYLIIVKPEEQIH